MRFWRRLIRYAMFIVLIISAGYMAFRAGVSGVSQKDSFSPKLFRTLPFLHSSPKKNITTEMENEKRVVDPAPVLKPEVLSETRKKNKREQKRNETKDTSGHLLPIGPSRTQAAVFYPYASGLLSQLKEDRVEKKKAREKTLPLFSDLFVPVYTAEQLDTRAFPGFYGPNTGDLLFVMEREIASDAAGRRYAISIYSDGGRLFLGTVETSVLAVFPFKGLPEFVRVGESFFEKTSRFFAFSSDEERLSEILSDQVHGEAILKTAYAASQDSRTFLGVEQNSGLHIYTLFPGIYLAESLR